MAVSPSATCYGVSSTPAGGPPSVSFSNTLTGSGSHLGALLGLMYRRVPNNDITATATYGGVSMTSLGRLWLNNVSPTGGTTQSFIEIFGLLNAASGLQTAQVDVSGTSVEGEGCFGCTVYSGVGGWGTLLSEFGTEAGTSSSITSGTIASGDYAAHLFGHESASTITNSGSPSGYTERAQLNFSIVTAQGIWGDAPGAGGTLTFTNSRGSGVDYAEMIVPIQAATVTSGMLAMF